MLDSTFSFRNLLMIRAGPCNFLSRIDLSFLMTWFSNACRDELYLIPTISNALHFLGHLRIFYSSQFPFCFAPSSRIFDNQINLLYSDVASLDYLQSFIVFSQYSTFFNIVNLFPSTPV